MSKHPTAKELIELLTDLGYTRSEEARGGYIHWYPPRDNMMTITIRDEDDYWGNRVAMEKIFNQNVDYEEKHRVFYNHLKSIGKPKTDVYLKHTIEIAKEVIDHSGQSELNEYALMRLKVTNKMYELGIEGLEDE